MKAYFPTIVLLGLALFITPALSFSQCSFDVPAMIQPTVDGNIYCTYAACAGWPASVQMHMQLNRIITRRDIMLRQLFSGIVSIDVPIVLLPLRQIWSSMPECSGRP